LEYEFPLEGNLQKQEGKDVKALLKNTEDATFPKLPQNKLFPIGIIGAGFIVQNCHLVAYKKAGFNPVAISSLSVEKCNLVVAQHGLKKVYADWHELIDDEEIEVIDIAVPPHLQLDIVKYACSKTHIKGILCQKPSFMTYEGAKEIVQLGKDSGKPIAVNSNMRYDQSIRALKYFLDQNLMGDPVLATFEQRAVSHWQNFLEQYQKLTIFSFSIHQLDILRYLFGNPKAITAVCRTDPRTKFKHTDGIVQLTYQYENGMRATIFDDVWAWPGEPCKKDTYSRWRVEGLDGMALGEIGWPQYPEICPSTFKATCKKYPNLWLEPKWDTAWFPDAFIGTMANLLCTIEEHSQPEVTAEDHSISIACAEACYISIAEQRTVLLEEILF